LTFDRRDTSRAIECRRIAAIEEREIGLGASRDNRSARYVGSTTTASGFELTAD